MTEQLLLLRHHLDVERWRGPVAEYGRLLAAWPERDVDYALTVIWHESRGRATAYNETYPEPERRASGLFQHLPPYWMDRISTAVSNLRDAGEERRWMRHPHLLDPEPTVGYHGRIRPWGPFAPLPNIAAAAVAYRWSQARTGDGWEPWTTTHADVFGKAITRASYGDDVWFWPDVSAYMRLDIP